MHQEITDVNMAPMLDQDARQVGGRHEAEHDANLAQRHGGIFRFLSRDAARQLFVAEQPFAGQQFADFFGGG